MKKEIRKFLILAIALLPAAAFAQPVIGTGGVLNVASYAFNGLPNSGIAQGSMFAVFGKRMGPAALQQINSFPLPLNLAGTSIKVSVSGTTVDAFLIYTSDAQLAAILPSNTPIGTGTITVTYNSQTSPAAPIRVVKSSFGAFAVNQAGSGPSVVQNVVSETDRPVNSLTKAARPGQYMILWGVGLGPVTGNEAAGVIPGDLPTAVEVYVGNKLAKITYKGRSGCCSGIDQVVFIVPDGVEGCYVPIAVKIGDIVSNYTTMAISKTSDVCSDPTSFSEQDLRTAQKNGVFRTGAISLSRSALNISFGGISAQSNTDSASGAFYKFTYDNLMSEAALSSTSIGACTVSTYQTAAATAVPGLPETLDAGPAITLVGPKGTKQLTKVTGGLYTADLGGGLSGVPGLPAAQPLYLDPGTYTVDNGSGGSGANAVGAFRATLTVTPFLKWENQSSITTVNRTQPLRLTWSGGDPNGMVIIFGGSATAAPVVGASFFCIEKAGAGQFTVPASVLLAMPVTGTDAGGVLAVSGTSGLTAFTASGLDSGSVSAVAASISTVSFQ